MTLIVGVKCSDGVVMGADGAATLGGPFGQQTIRQPVHKLAIISEKLVLGVSGTVGMSQLLRHELDDLCKAGSSFLNTVPHNAKDLIRAKLWPHFERAFKSATVAQPILGAAAAAEAVHTALVAIPLKADPCLLQITPQCGIEEASSDLPFVAIGSGQTIADPFLAFIRRVFWPPGNNPTVAEGVFAALWTLKHVIATAPGLVAEPYELAVLEKGAKGWTARLLEDDDNELLEQEESVANAEGSLRRFRNIMEEPRAEGQEDRPPKVPESPATDSHAGSPCA